MDTLPPADLTCRCGQELHIPVTATFDPDGRVVISVDHEWLNQHFAGHEEQT
jgi:hypothetical protein